MCGESWLGCCLIVVKSVYGVCVRAYTTIRIRYTSTHRYIRSTWPYCPSPCLLFVPFVAFVAFFSKDVII